MTQSQQYSSGEEPFVRSFQSSCDGLYGVCYMFSPSNDSKKLESISLNAMWKPEVGKWRFERSSPRSFKLDRLREGKVRETSRFKV
jgi:hypothetical protein